jgi:hypothetical protein
MSDQDWGTWIHSGCTDDMFHFRRVYMNFYSHRTKESHK